MLSFKNLDFFNIVINQYIQAIREILMNKTVSRFKKTFRVFGIKIAENEEQYECVNMENVEPINPFIITEYEMENYKNQKDE